ncbi:MAG TPA: ABC transporter ATP-binding protein [Gemmatimonadaceae bacterium]|nr:ABC transporter ATP-binding protein [Gemmatimonadaceae bacterium]
MSVAHLAFELRHVTKRFGTTRALDDVTLALPADRIAGLIGKNGSGKTTLLRHVIGLQLPTTGACVTLGTPTPELGPAELSRIGVVQQDDRFLPWMRVEQQIRYVSTFYERWDHALEQQLVQLLELDREARVGALSPGNAQKMAIVLAMCHHPALLLLDEPLSDLDPIAREATLSLLLERFRSEPMTIVISSHILRDIERIVDSVVCLHEGRLVAHEPLDALQERFAEWIVASPAGRLPIRFSEPFVLAQQGDGYQARLTVRDPVRHVDSFRARYDVEIRAQALNLERAFPLLLDGHANGNGSVPDESPAVLARTSDAGGES